MILEVPMRLGRGLNDRSHWRVRWRHNMHEREAISWPLRALKRPELPCVVTLTRIAPSNGLDDDNLVTSLKACRDAFAEWIGVDDKLTDVVRYEYRQERGKWAVRVEVIPRHEPVAVPRDTNPQWGEAA